MSETIEDGFGGVWYRCEYSDCDLSVVRPGKVQCSRCDTDALRSECAVQKEMIEQIITEAKGTALEKFAMERYEYLYGSGGTNPFTAWKVEYLERENQRLETRIRFLEEEKRKGNSGDL